MSILITLGNLNPFTFANSIIAANLKAIELFGESLGRIEVFHSMESFDVLQAEKRKDDEISWSDHLERYGIEEKIFVHRTLEASSTRESVEQFINNLEPIVSNVGRKAKSLLLDLSNGTTLSKNMLSNAANLLNIPYKYMIDVIKLFKITDEKGFIEGDILKQSYVPAPDSIHLNKASYEDKKSTVNKTKILFMASNPKGGSPLKLGNEFRAINEKIRSAKYRDFLELESVWAVRADDLIQALNEYKPVIVHFSGHGGPSDKIFLTDSMGLLPHAVNSQSLKALFKCLKDNIRVVVLNACYSKVLAEPITEIIDCAIGMKTEIGDKSAMVFAASFYQAIGFGRSVQEAFEQGKLALNLEGIHGEDKPELFVKNGINPASLYPIGPLSS